MKSRKFKATGIDVAEVFDSLNQRVRGHIDRSG